MSRSSSDNVVDGGSDLDGGGNHAAARPPVAAAAPVGAWIVPATSIYAARLSGELLSEHLLVARERSFRKPATRRAKQAAHALGQAHSDSALARGAKAFAQEWQHLHGLAEPHGSAGISEDADDQWLDGSSAGSEDGVTAELHGQLLPAELRAPGGGGCWREEVVRTE